MMDTRHDKIRRSLGQNHARIRRRQGLTQTNVAERTGIPVQYLSSLEQGRRNPTIETLARLAKALEVDLTELFAFGIED